MTSRIVRALCFGAGLALGIESMIYLATTHIGVGFALTNFGSAAWGFGLAYHCIDSARPPRSGGREP